MELPHDANRLPKLPFLVGDLIFLSIAAFLAYTAGAPPSTASIIGIVICTGLGVALGVAPFLADYAKLQDHQLREREQALEAMIRSTATAGDQASIAAAGLSEIAETTKQNLHLIDELPAKIRSARQAAEKSVTSKSTEGLEDLRAEFATLRTELENQQRTLSDKLDDQQKALMGKFAEALSALKTRPPVAVVPTTASPDSPAPSPPPAAPTKKKSRKKKTPPPVEDSLFTTAATAEPPETPTVPQTANRDDAPTTKKSVISDIATGTEPDDLAPETTPPAQPDSVETAKAPTTDDEAAIPAADPSPDEALTEVVAEEPAPVKTSSEEMIDEPVPDEPALSADGVTRLTVTAYIGIGNRLFIRGDGPGLSQEEGIPLQFVSIGKWRWETDAASAPVKATLWKNDEEECTALGEIQLSPGAQLETSASF